MSTIVSCGVIVFRREPKLSFLLMRHANRWDLPKGHLDPDETFRQCALRELDEETGIESENVAIDDDFLFTLEYQVRLKRHDFQPQPKRLLVFLGFLNCPVKIQLTEHVGYEWFEWHPPHRIQSQTIDPVLKAVEDYWSNQHPPSPPAPREGIRPRRRGR